MPAMLLPFMTRYLPYLLAGALAVGVVVYVWHMHEALQATRAEMAAAQSTISDLRQTNQENLLELARLQKQQAEWDGEMLVAQQNDTAQRKIAQQIDTAIAATSPAQNAPAAPVLTATLSSLAHMQGARQ
jgi:peroxiredoxin family protein